MFKEPLKDGSGERMYTSADEKRRRSSADLIKALDTSITVRLGAYDLMHVRIPLGTLLNPMRPGRSPTAGTSSGARSTS
ncbi:hypothetical protein B0H13DRAFT_2348139 [Mycena leptocephala]|nr:hypothetical protein B0H13DRAFT_2348139 [Mycena leptocephala]